jgi:hypothetical protein
VKLTRPGVVDADGEGLQLLRLLFCLGGDGVEVVELGGKK